MNSVGDLWYSTAVSNTMLDRAFSTIALGSPSGCIQSCKLSLSSMTGIRLWISLTVPTATLVWQVLFALMEEANRNAKFWAGVLNSLRNRGVEDILIAAFTDNLTGSIKQPYPIRYGCI